MTMQTTSIRIPRAEFQARAEKLLAHVRHEKLSGVVLFDNFHILYYSGFAFIPTERPIAWLLNSTGEQGMYVPRLELEHAQAKREEDQKGDQPEVRPVHKRRPRLIHERPRFLE